MKPISTALTLSSLGIVILGVASMPIAAKATTTEKGKSGGMRVMEDAPCPTPSPSPSPGG